MPSPHPNHTVDQLRGGARDFCTVFDQVPSFYVWEAYFTEAFASTSIAPDGMQALRNATLDSSLLNIRLLNDFFAPRKYPTDIGAEDYTGYTAPGPFLETAEAQALNKHLAHLTTERAESSPKNWSIYDIIRRCHDAAITFIRFLNSSTGSQYRPQDLDLDSRIRMCETIEADMRKFLKQPKA